MLDKATSVHEHAHDDAPTHPHTYVIFMAFSRQQWFRERVSVLRYRYIVCIVTFLQSAELCTTLACAVTTHLKE